MAQLQRMITQTVEIRVLMINYILHKKMDVITYQFNHFSKSGPHDKEWL